MKDPHVEAHLHGDSLHFKGLYFPGSSPTIPFGAWATVKGGLRPSLGRFAFRSPYDSTRAPKGGALPITGKELLTESTLENL